MATEYKLSYTAAEIDEKLGQIDGMVKSVNGKNPDENGNVIIDTNTLNDEQIKNAVNDYLIEHPEATTTVQDGSITEAKLSNEVKSLITPDYSKYKAVFLGDSNTAINTCKTKPWCNWVAELLGVGSFVNYGQNGATLTNLGKSATPICSRCETIDDDASMIFVMGGVNEFRVDTQSPVGNINDTTPETIYGAVRYICRTLLTRFPAKPIIFVTPTNQKIWTHPEINMAELANIIYEACKIEGVLCLDAQASLCVNPFYESKYVIDGVHLGDLGSEYLGKWVANQVKVNVPVMDFESENPDDNTGEDTTITVESLMLNKTNLSMVEGDDAQLLATIMPNNATNKSVIWESSNNSVATVANGIVMAIAKGNCTITAKASENTSVYATCNVTVEAKENEEEKETVTLYMSNYNVNDGYIDNNGNVASAGGWKYTELIPIPANTELTIRLEARLNPIFYDAEQNWISSGNLGGSLMQGTLTDVTVTSPENAAYIVLNISGSTTDHSLLWIKYMK